MKLKPFLALVLFFSTSSSMVFAHGENKPGPHGGYIRMPGAFHTELLKVNEATFIVYLLDMEWKNPTIKDSKVIVRVKSKLGEQAVNCAPEKDAFLCKLSKNWKWSELTEINIEPNRQGSQGGVAPYRFPLSYD